MAHLIFVGPPVLSGFQREANRKPTMSRNQHHQVGTPRWAPRDPETLALVSLPTDSRGAAGPAGPGDAAELRAAACFVWAPGGGGWGGGGGGGVEGVEGVEGWRGWTGRG